MLWKQMAMLRKMLQFATKLEARSGLKRKLVIQLRLSLHYGGACSAAAEENEKSVQMLKMVLDLMKQVFDLHKGLHKV